MRHNGGAVIACLACDLAPGGAELGVDSKRRAKRTKKLFDKLSALYTTIPMIVVSAKKANERKYPNQQGSIAEAQKRYLVSLGVPESCIHIGELDWSSEKELIAAKKFAEELARSLGKPVTIYFVTSWYHWPRVKLLASLWIGMKTKGVMSSGRLVIALLELIKFPVQVLAIIAGRVSGKRAKQ